MLKITRIIFAVSLTSVLIFSPVALVLGAEGPPPTDPTVPVVETGAVSSVTSYSANFAGAVTDPGSETPTEQGFQYGTSTDYGSSVSETGSFVSGYTYLSQFSGHGEVVVSHPENIRGIAFDSNGNMVLSGRANQFVDKFDSSEDYLSNINGQDGVGFYSPSGVVFDASDNMYLVDSGNFRVQKFNSSGVYQSQFGSEGTGDGEFASGAFASGPTGIAIDGSGNIYVVDTGNNRVQKFNSSGVYQSQFGSEGTGDGEFDRPTYIAIRGSDIYVSDSNNVRVQRFNLSGVYQSQFGSEGNGDGEFTFLNGGPGGIAIDGSGNVYVVDSGGNRIQKFNSSGVYQSQFGSAGSGEGEFNFPLAIGIRGENIFVSNPFDSHIEKFTLAGTFVSEISSYISDTADGLLNNPDAFAQDSAGNVYVADRFNHRVVKFNAAGDYLLQFGSEGTGDGQFMQPGGIAVDEDGYIYVGDQGSRIQKFNSLGVYQSQFGSEGTGDGEFDGVVGQMIFDAAGNLYVVDSNAHRIQKFNSSGVYQSQFGSNGSGDGEFDGIADLAFDSAGNIYVADQNNRRIQKFNSSGVYQSQFVGVEGTANGEFFGVDGITIDAEDNFFIADGSIKRIQKFDSAWNYITKFGIEGSDDGQFSEIHDMGFDLEGNIMALDSNTNDRIQKFQDQSVAGAYALSVTNLACGTYHYRAFATNSVGTGYGNDGTFTTGRCPQTSGGAPVAHTPPTVENILGSGLCPANLIISDFMKQGDKNGVYSKYNGKITTQVATLQDHVNRILAAQYNQAAGPKDGKFGPLTRQGVMRLQTALNQILKPVPTLKVDGIIGSFTRDAINHSCRVQ
jgi:sugar lactone lactonase YvrE